MNHRRVLVCALLLAVGLIGVGEASAQEDARQPHPEIKIANDEQWSECSCVSGGSGTAEDPWIIEDLRIISDSQPNDANVDAPIRVLLTQDHAVFRNITILDSTDAHETDESAFGVDGNASEQAIQVTASDNLAFENITVRHGPGYFEEGFFFGHTKNLRVENVDLRGPGLGIKVTNSGIGGGYPETIRLKNVHASTIDLFQVDDIRIQNASAGELDGTLLDEARLENVEISGRTELDPTRDGTITAENVSTGEILTGVFLSLGRSPLTTPLGDIHIANMTVEEGDFDNRDSNLTLENVDMAGDFVAKPGIGSDDLSPDISLTNVSVGGDLSIEQPGAIHTDNNTVAGTYTVFDDENRIDAWTVGEPDTALGGHRVHVLRPGDVLRDTQVPYVTVIGEGSQPALIENVTLLGPENGPGFYFQGSVEARYLDVFGTPQRAIIASDGDLVLTDTQLTSERTGIMIRQGSLTMSNVTVDGGFAGITALASDVQIQRSRIRALGNYHGLSATSGSNVTLVDTLVESGDVGIAAGGVYQDTYLQLTRTAVVASGPALTNSEGGFIDAANCYLEGGRKPGARFASGVDVFYTIGVREDTTIDHCTIHQARERTPRGTPTEVIRNAPEGRNWGKVTVEHSNIVGEGHHYDEGLFPFGDARDFSHNWWGPNDLPLAGYAPEIGPIELHRINDPPSVTVQPVTDGWRLNVTDDHALIRDAGWRLEDGATIEADGEWPLWNTTLSEDRLDPGGHHVRAFATDVRDATTTRHAALLVPDPSGDPTVVIDGPLETAPSEATTYTAKTAGTVATIEWDLGDDGTTDATGDAFTFTPQQAGTRSLAVTVADGAGTSRTDAITIEVVNPPPIAALKGPHAATVDEGVTLDSTSTDETGIANTTWDVHADGVPDGFGASFTYTPDRPGLHLVELRVEDDHGAQSTATRVLDVEAGPPGAPGLNVTPSPPNAGNPVRIAVDNVTDPRIDVGDDGTIDAADDEIIWRFETAGTYPVRILDGHGDPVLHATIDVLAPDELSFTTEGATAGEASTLAAQGDGWAAFTWDIHDDGTVDQHGETATVVPSDSGPLDVRLTARSADETRTVTRTIQVQDRNRSMHVGLEPSRGLAPLNATMYVQLASPDTPTSWSLDVDGDATADRQGTGVPPARLDVDRAQTGTYAATLTVSFDDGATLEKSVDYTVLAPDEQVPSIELGFVARQRPVEGEPVATVVKATSATELASYEICLGSRCRTGSLEGPNATVQADLQAPAGTHTLVARITDAEGNTGEASRAFEVATNHPPLVHPDLPEAVLAGEAFDLPIQTVDPENRTTTITWSVPSLEMAGQGRSKLVLPGGTYHLEVTATDPSGAKASRTVAVTVLETLDLGLDLAPSEHTTHGIHGIDVFLQPAWSQAPAQVEGILAVDWRAAPGQPWTGVSSREFEGSTQTIHLEGPFPPGQVRVSATVVATQPPSAPIADDGHTATASQILEVGPG